MQDKAVVNTNVAQVVVDDLSDIFGGGVSAANVVTAQDGVKPSIFSKEGVDSSFLDRPLVGDGNSAVSRSSVVDEGEKDDGKVGVGEEGGISTETIESILDTVGEEGDDDVADKKVGRPKTDRSGLVDFFRKQIEGGRMFAFDDYDEGKEGLGDYLERLSPKDFDELWEANHRELSKQSQEEVGRHFFETLPTELQYAYKYVADGGQDMKGLFQALSQVEETRALDVDDVDDQEKIYRQYLSAIDFGTAEEIDEEISTWKDLGQLDKKAKQAKPKLDKMQEGIVTKRLEQQEQLRAQEEAAAQAYVENVYRALEPGDVNGLRLDKKMQSFLYNGMVSAQYPSITGKPTNLLGHLLEKYQFVEPDYRLITEALWLLSDPEGYRSVVKQSGVNEEVVRTVRALKTEESRKVAAVEQRDGGVPARRKISKPGNIFKR